MSNILVRSAIVVLLLAIPAFGTGALFGPEWGWSLFCLALLVLLLHHVRHIHALRRWASRSLTESVPEGSGAWEEVFTLLYRRQRAEIEQRRTLAHSLARSRQAGRAPPHGAPILAGESRTVRRNGPCEAPPESD